jgi:iron(III) transport system ATP-binding protein
MTGLILEHVTHAFDGVTVVDDVSLSVGDGEILCLLGPSGCGKSTTLRIAAGLEELQQGRVLIRDTLVACESVFVPPEAREVGLVFQDYALFPHLTVLDNVAFGLTKLASGERQARAMDMLERVGMARYRDSYPHMLSGGEQQRVALARALAPRPRLMLMDEPFSGLDIRLRDQVRDDTLALLKDMGTTTLLVTHDPEEAMRMADTIALMNRGRVAQVGTPEEIYSQPRSGFVVRFFSETNRGTGVVHQGRVESPLGVFTAEGLAEGAPVELLIRPEALQIGETGVPARLLDARFLGSSVLARLEVAGWPEILTARLRGPVPEAPSNVNIDVAWEHAFVLPQEPDS